jgi:probable F420-dependent oxidoreductase
MKLGLALPHYDSSFPDQQPATFDRVARYAELAESLGFFQLWVSDHFWLDLERYGGAGRQGTPECWTMLSALATRTSRVRLGTLVMAVGFRPPTLLAKMAATLDQLADGRLDLGLGAGWNEAEFTENGLPFPRPGERLAMLEEALQVLRTLLNDAGAPASFRGRFFRAEQAPVVPGPVQRPRPPLWVGGKGDRLLGVVARAADGWNLCWSVTPEDYRERLTVLAAACERADRPPGDVRRSLGLSTLLGRDADDLVERWRRLQAWTPGGILDGVELRDWAASRLVGTPDEVVTQLRNWEERGVEQVICSYAGLPFSVFEDEQLDLTAEGVLPRLDQ